MGQGMARRLLDAGHDLSVLSGGLADGDLGEVVDVGWERMVELPDDL